MTELTDNLPSKTEDGAFSRFQRFSLKHEFCVGQTKLHPRINFEKKQQRETLRMLCAFFWFPLLMVFMVSCSRTPNTRIKKCWVDLCMWRDTINTSILAIFVETAGVVDIQIRKGPRGPPDVLMGKMSKVGTLHILDFPRNFRMISVASRSRSFEAKTLGPGVTKRWELVAMQLE